MTHHRIESTAEANSHARAIDAWWREHRGGTPDLFLDDLARVFALISSMPMIGVTCQDDAAPEGMRRFTMRRAKCHVYYTVDATKREILVHAIWHQSRGQGPF